MSTTQKQAPAAAAEAPAPAAGGVSPETAAEPGAAPAPETTGQGAGDTAAPAANETGGQGAASGGEQPETKGGQTDDGLSPLQRAHRRAAERLKDKAAGEQQTSTSSSEEQAAAGEAGGESTATSGEAKPTAEAEAAAASAEAGQAAGESDSTAQAAPENWPAERREAFSKLPDAARSLVLDMNRDMEAGLNKAFQDIAQIRESHGDLVNTMQETGYSQEGATELLKLGKAFQENPKSVLAQLARDNGIDVWFERPLAEGEVPEFNSTAEMVQYMEQRAQKIAEDMVSSERQKAQTEAEKKAEEERATQAQAAIRQELEEAAKTHSDFNDHRVNVMETAQRVNEDGLTIEEAYRLATYDGLRKLAEEGATAKQELSALKAKLEKESKEFTRPIPGTRGGGAATPNEDEDLSPLERAGKRARARIQARQSA